MKRKDLDDFERFLRRFCQQHELELVIRHKGGSHRSYLLKTKNGRTVGSAVIKAGKKEISAGTLRNIVKALQVQLARQSARDLWSILKELIDEFVRWLAN